MINHEEKMEKIIREIQDKGFVPIQEHYKRVPTKMMTRFGIVDITKEIEHEIENKPPSFVIGDSWMTKSKGTRVLGRLACYLYSRPSILADYLLQNFDLNMKKEDFIIGGLLKSYKVKVEKSKKTRLLNTKRNYFIDKNKMYIGWKDMIIVCEKSNQYWKIVGSDKIGRKGNVKNDKLVRAV